MVTRCWRPFPRFVESSGRRLRGAALLLAALSLAVVSAGQSAPDAKQGEAPRTVRVPLKHAEANDVAQLVGSVLVEPCRIAVDASTNSLIIAGPPGAVERAQQTVALLDVAAEKREAPRRQFIEVPTGVSKELLNAASMLLGRESRVASADGTLIVVGPEEDQKAVAELVERVTAGRASRGGESQPVQIAFYVLETTLGDAKADRTPGGTPLPQSLAAVGQSLAEAGFGNPRLVAPLLVHTSTDGQRFQVSGASPDAPELLIKGSVGPGPTPQSVRLEVEAGVERDTPQNIFNQPQQPQRMRRGVFSLNTAITLPWNDYVVLAASPSDATEPTGFALVVQVTTPTAAAAKPAKPTGR